MSLDLLIARQAGVVSRDQALRAGLSGAAVDHLLRTRRWHPLHPCVYRVPGHGREDEARARAALLWAGDGAALCGATAAWWLGLLARPPATLRLTAPTRRPPRAGVAVRCRPLPVEDRVLHRGVAVTAAGLTVLEAARELGGREGELLLDRALEERVGWAEVLGAHARHPTSAAAPLLAGAAAEAALVRLLRTSGLRGWHRHPGRRAVVFPSARVVVEAAPGCTDGAARAQPACDSRVLRFGRGELATRPEAVLAAVAGAVGA
ncbi:type IV toxin-antitoxin system AbiEi family antitoxin domain-containing protein [Pseudonocardia sp. MH-G8]|uniref:type IV toxin-antitoxin system AbiEi family antitoxin domain-containing protein n=1 Tax=Pseudonocardia sp. MH-G8 TaxID=1854588 RepID=UPI000BA15E2E|nr:type IV toxin-antitoxin system AbiEi family antitoxin domain-containing protein [Pseudonocardia sp. MH-G8]OZM83773.1 hypothetical protein CFP66_04690 [Pseudonocardia sp. MH-G8]